MNFIVYSFAVLKSVIYGLSVFFTGKLTSSVDVLDVLALRFILSFSVLWLLKILKILKIEIGIKDSSDDSRVILPAVDERGNPLNQLIILRRLKNERI